MQMEEGGEETHCGSYIGILTLNCQLLLSREV